MNRLFVALILFITAACSQAEQQYFQRRDLGDNIQFDYQWLDHQGQPRELSVQLDKRKL